MECSFFLKDHVHIVQAGDEAAAVNLAAASCSVVEPDAVGEALAESGNEGNGLGVVAIIALYVFPAFWAINSDSSRDGF